MGQRLLQAGRDVKTVRVGARLRLKGMSFGNIRNENLTRIWNKKEYVRFRDLFDPESRRKGEQICPEMPECCKRCYKRLEKSAASHEVLSGAAPISDMVLALC
jgi:MoaA/NifB/PqqE/SkfB family radical SAM enzyme